MEMTWRLSSGESVNINLLLVDPESLFQPTDAFKQRYNERSKISDYISYSGHSGMGANIRALAKMGTFLPGQYQIFFMNGCDTFFYVDDSLRAAHEAVNPGSKPYEFFDILTNAMPSPFAQMANQNLIVVSSLLRQKDSYRQMLARFHPYQRAIVMGEEDNQFQP